MCANGALHPLTCRWEKARSPNRERTLCRGIKRFCWCPTAAIEAGAGRSHSNARLDGRELCARLSVAVLHRLRNRPARNSGGIRSLFFETGVAPRPTRTSKRGKNI